MSEMKYEVEVCAGLVQSVIEAERGGASRVELCANLFEGGTTPSAATIEMSCSMVGIPVYVIIRPRGGDFLYSDLEFEIMKRDVAEAKKYGASGIATGILLPDGSVDERRTGELVDMALNLGMGATFHRAFDMTENPAEALEAIIRTGCERILTSGGRNKAFEGKTLIGQLVALAAGRISLMAGSGVNPENVAELVESTGVREIHVSGKRRVEGGMKYRNTDIMMGGLPGIPEYEVDVTDAETVRRTVQRLNGLNRA